MPACLQTACPPQPPPTLRDLHEWPGAGDIIATCSDIEGPQAAVPNVQYFWEAFPAGSGPMDRTTYMFAYMDAEPHRQAPIPNPSPTTQHPTQRSQGSRCSS